MYSVCKLLRIFFTDLSAVEMNYYWRRDEFKLSFVSHLIVSLLYNIFTVSFTKIIYSLVKATNIAKYRHSNGFYSLIMITFNNYIAYWRGMRGVLRREMIRHGMQCGTG